VLLAGAVLSGAVLLAVDLWGKFWVDPRREFGGVYRRAKFG